MFSIDPVDCEDLDDALSIKVGVPCFMPYKGLKVKLALSGHAVLGIEGLMALFILLQAPYRMVAKSLESTYLMFPSS